MKFCILVDFLENSYKDLLNYFISILFIFKYLLNLFSLLILTVMKFKYLIIHKEVKSILGAILNQVMS